MKNILKHAVPAIWILFGTLWGQHAAAAIDAKISFETEIPKAFVCGENSAAELSGLHYKDGSRSLRWSWSAPSTLRFNDFGQLMRSLRVKGAGVMLWIYNPRAVDADMRFSFETPTGEVPYRFDFHMDFTGWRACWIKYNDMPGDHASQQVSRLTISTPAGVESGELFLDRLTFSCTKDARMHGKVAASIVSCRRGGATAAFDRLNKYFQMSNMVVVGSQYWNQVHGFTPDEVRKDLEGLQTMRTLARNIAWITKCIEAGRQAGIDYPTHEPVTMTNFID
mgnify:CR=1 FL=1